MSVSLWIVLIVIVLIILGVKYYNQFVREKLKVEKADSNIVVMDLGKLEGIILPTELLPGENYNVNDKI